MTKQGGLGDVVVKAKRFSNELISSMTAVKHRNNIDIWFVCSIFDYGVDAEIFKSYLITSKGITDSVISPVVHLGGDAPYMHCSPNGYLLLMLNQLEQFDNSTGEIYREDSFGNLCDTCRSNGTGIFSPDGSKLYMIIDSGYGIDNVSSDGRISEKIYQFEVSSDINKMTNSKKQIGNTYISDLDRGYLNHGLRPNEDGNKYYYDMQCGPDGKLYISRWDTTYLSVITNPNEDASKINFIENGVDLKGSYGLGFFPQFMNNYYNVFFTANATPTVCEGDTIFLSASISDSAATAVYTWTGPAGFKSNEQNPVIFPARLVSKGNYICSVNINGAIIDDTLSVGITPGPPFQITGNKFLCIDSTTTLKCSLGGNSYKYLWSTGDTTAQIIVTKEDIYTLHVTYTGTGCTSTNSATVTSIPAPNPQIVGANDVCQETNYTYNSQVVIGQTNRWSAINGTILGSTTGDTVNVKWGSPYSGTLTITKIAVNTDCAGSLSIPVIISPQPPKPEISANGSDLQSSSQSGNQWYFNGKPITGAINSDFTPTESGTYTVQTIDPNSLCASTMSDPYVYVIGEVSESPKSEIRIYPNPAQDFINISGLATMAQIGDIEIYSVYGAKVNTPPNPLLLDGGQVKIDVSGLATGVYFCKIVSGKDVKTGKFVVVR